MTMADEGGDRGGRREEGDGLAPQIEITLSRDRLDTDDISYQRPSVPIRDVKFINQQ